MTGFKIHRKEITYRTSKLIEFVDMTRDIERIVEESRIKDGLAHVFVPHATAAIIANEYEQGLLGDYVRLIRELFRPGGDWMHNRIDNNAHAHLAAGIIGADRSFPVENGKLVRGTWQNIFLVELDGPRSMRRVIVTVAGEAF
ncbi:MAG: secondary thiamine-phosphate synthase enzyme YjbQ [Desulfurococcales archaeon]|nr:secondary thiamine-phosphate synthase enzyme YjbQ [Desulfurococcales archaeon]